MLERVILFGGLRTRGDELDEPTTVVLIPRREYFVRKEDSELTRRTNNIKDATEGEATRRGRTMGERNCNYLPGVQTRQY